MKEWLLKGLAHIGIMTDDVDACMAFYVDNLGFERYYQFTTASGNKLGFVRGGSCVLEFIESAARPAGGPVDHIALEVQNLDAAVAQLRARGIVFEMETSNTIPGLFPTGSRMNFFTGPAGERVELYEYAR